MDINRIIITISITMSLVSSAAVITHAVQKNTAKDERVDTVDQIELNVQEARKLNDSVASVESYIASSRETAAYYNGYFSTVDETDSTVKARNAELGTAVVSLNTKLASYESRFGEIKDSDADNAEKVLLINGMTNEAVYTELEAAKADCETKRLAVAEALKAWEDWKVREQERKEREASEAAERERREREEASSSSSSGNGTSLGSSGTSSRSGSSSGSGGSLSSGSSGSSGSNASSSSSRQSSGGSSSGGSSGSGSGGGTSGGGGISNVDTQPKNPSTAGGIRLQPESGGNATSGDNNSNR